MGVAGLWEVLRPAGQVRSLTELAVEDGFKANPSNQRGFRIGIDASIWFFHAAYGREGENPELRTLFFRCCRLLQSPLLPLFIFDGPNRPAIKRGKRVGGNVHWLTQGMKNIIDAFGFEWRVAPGEAEAELAYLNRIGIIDAVLSDDVDNFLFGATMVIRNPSNTLSGNRAHPVKNAQGKDDGNHVATYAADAILSNPSVGLSRSGTILVGLLSGGDYIPAGLPGCGQKFATGLARAGFGDSLLRAVRELKGARLDAFLDQWRQDIRNELRTNKRGCLPSKKPTLAASLPDDFPSLPVLMSYADPITSENTPQKGNRKTPPVAWRNDPDPMRIASLCELYFEWGVKDVIVQRFRTVLWPGIVCRAIRRVVVNEDQRRRPPLSGRQTDNEEADDIAGPPSPTKRLISTLSSLALSSPKKSSALVSSPSDPTESEPFTLSLLVPLTTASPDSSRLVSPCSPTSPTFSPSPLLLEVLSQRTHASTDFTLEYRVLVDPTSLVDRAESGVKGLRPPLVGGLFGVDPEDEDEDEDGGTMDSDGSGSDDASGFERLETAAAAASRSGTKKRKARREVPTKPLRLWLPACMIRAAAPALAEAYDAKVKVREEKKAKRGTTGTRGRGRRVGTGARSTSRTSVRGNADGDGADVPGPSMQRTETGPKTKSNGVKIGGGGRRRKPKHASEAQDEAYEFIDLSAGESPCPSDTEDVEKNTKGKGKAKGKSGQRELAKAKKANTKADATNKKGTTTKTMKEHFKTTKPSTSQLPADKASSLNPTSLRRVCEDEEGDSADPIVPPPLSQSLRPLDLLRAKRRPGSAAVNRTTKSKSKPQAKSTTILRYEEEPSSSSPSRPSVPKAHTSILPCLPGRPTPKARKKPLFVDVSDTESDIEVSDVRRPLSATTATIATNDKAETRTSGEDGDMTVSLGVGNTVASASVKNIVGVIDLTARGNVLRSMTASVRPPRVPLDTGTIDPTQSAQSSSKLAHILLPPSALESEEDGDVSDGDGLPTFHRGSAKSRMKIRSTDTRPAPRPFPVQLAPESLESPRASKLGRKDRGHKTNDDMVEIVDVFTTPRGPSPPRSPTPSPSSDQSLLTHTSSRPSTFVKSRKANDFPDSPTRCMTNDNAEIPKGMKQRRDASSNTPVSGNENGILKSPRKSEAHSSPRHVDGARRRASSPTPFASSNPRPLIMDDTVERKPRRSDASAIYISSGSEDEDKGNAELDVVHSEVEVDEDTDECTDRDVDARADIAVILSAPPSPARLAKEDSVPGAPAVEAARSTNPGRASKFKPVLTAASGKMGVRALSAQSLTSVQTASKSLKHDEDTIAPRPARLAPLLVARSRCKNREDYIIDLTSD